SKSGSTSPSTSLIAPISRPSSFYGQLGSKIANKVWPSSLSSSTNSQNFYIDDGSSHNNSINNMDSASEDEENNEVENEGDNDNDNGNNNDNDDHNDIDNGQYHDHINHIKRQSSNNSDIKKLAPDITINQ